MGKCSVESAEDCPASTHGRSRFAGVICAAICFILTCSLVVYTFQWERRSEIESRQQMENLYELKNIVDRLNTKLKNYNTSLENVVVNFGDVSEKMDVLTQNVHSSHNSMIDVNDAASEFKTSLDELKEIFVKYRNEKNEMKRKQVEMKTDLDKSQSNNNVSSNHHEVDKDTKVVPTEIVTSRSHTSLIEAISKQTLNDLSVLDDANDVLKYGTIPSLQLDNIEFMEILEDFDKKNYSSKMENCQASKTELQQSILINRQKLEIFNRNLRLPSRVFQQSIEMILVSKAKDNEYQMRIHETKSLLTDIHSILGEMTENIEEFVKKFQRIIERMEECASRRLLVESNEQIPEQGGDELDFVDIIYESNRNIKDLFRIKKSVVAYNDRIFALELQMDNTGLYDSDNHDNDEVSLQETANASESNPVVVEGPVVRSIVSISEVEGSGVQGQEPILVQRKSHESEERDDNLQEKTSTLRDSSSGGQNTDGLKDVLDNALDKLESNNNGSSAQPNVDKDTKDVPLERIVSQNHTSFLDPRSINRKTAEEFIILDDAYHNLRFDAVTKLSRKNNILKGILEDFEKKNYSSKMENCQVNTTELRDTILMYSKNVNILKNGLSYPLSILSPTVEKIFASKAKYPGYQIRADETKIQFTIIHSRLNIIIGNIVEFENKLLTIVDCIEKYRNMTLRLEPNEQRPEQVGQQLDVDKIMSEIDTIADDLLHIRRNIIEYDRRISALELQIDNAGNFRNLINNEKQKKDPFQGITGVPDNSPVVISDVSITEVEGSEIQGQEPVQGKTSTQDMTSSGSQNKDSLEDSQDNGNSFTEGESRTEKQKSESTVDDEVTTQEDKENSHVDEENQQGRASITKQFFETRFQQVTWTEAKEKCEAKDMRLAVIANAKEWDSIWAVMIQSGIRGIKQDSFWISELDQTVKDSLPPLMSHYRISEHNNGAELCPFIDVYFAWESPCSDKRSYICENTQ